MTKTQDLGGSKLRMGVKAADFLTSRVLYKNGFQGRAAEYQVVMPADQAHPGVLSGGGLSTPVGGTKHTNKGGLSTPDDGTKHTPVCSIKCIPNSSPNSSQVGRKPPLPDDLHLLKGKALLAPRGWDDERVAELHNEWRMLITNAGIDAVVTACEAAKERLAKLPLPREIRDDVVSGHREGEQSDGPTQEGLAMAVAEMDKLRTGPAPDYAINDIVRNAVRLHPSLRFIPRDVIAKTITKYPAKVLRYAWSECDQYPPQGDDTTGQYLAIFRGRRSDTGGWDRYRPQSEREKPLTQPEAEQMAKELNDAWLAKAMA